MTAKTGAKSVKKKVAKRAKPQESKELREYKRIENAVEEAYLKSRRSGYTSPNPPYQPKKEPKDLRDYKAKQKKRREGIMINAD